MTHSQNYSRARFKQTITSKCTSLPRRRDCQTSYHALPDQTAETPDPVTYITHTWPTNLHYTHSWPTDLHNTHLTAVTRIAWPNSRDTWPSDLHYIHSWPTDLYKTHTCQLSSHRLPDQTAETPDPVTYITHTPDPLTYITHTWQPSCHALPDQTAETPDPVTYITHTPDPLTYVTHTWPSDLHYTHTADPLTYIHTQLTHWPTLHAQPTQWPILHTPNPVTYITHTWPTDLHYIHLTQWPTEHTPDSVTYITHTANDLHSLTWLMWSAHWRTPSSPPSLHFIAFHLQVSDIKKQTSLSKYKQDVDSHRGKTHCTHKIDRNTQRHCWRRCNYWASYRRSTHSTHNRSFQRWGGNDNNDHKQNEKIITTDRVSSTNTPDWLHQGYCPHVNCTDGITSIQLWAEYSFHSAEMLRQNYYYYYYYY